MKSAYYWEQTFPPQKETVIHHHYIPAIGASVGSSLSLGDGKADHSYDKYGIDSSFMAALNKAKPFRDAKKHAEGMIPKGRHSLAGARSRTKITLLSYSSHHGIKSAVP